MSRKRSYTVATLGLLMVLYYLMKKRKKQRRKRRWWIRPMLLDREEKGQYNNLFKFIQNHDHEQFFNYTRLTVTQFHKLLDSVREPLTKKRYRKPLSPEHRLVITLYYLALGGSMQLTAWSFYVSKSIVSNIVKETSRVIWDIFSLLYLAVPTMDEWKSIEYDFRAIWNMPYCLGAVDGKHILVQAPKKFGSLDFNYNRSYSIVLMALSNANYNFTLVDIGEFQCFGSAE